MKKLKQILALVIVSGLMLAGSLSAQDEGTYIDNASPKDSSYTDGDALDFGEYEEESNNNSPLIIGAIIVVAGAVVFYVMRKKKKK